MIGGLCWLIAILATSCAANFEMFGISKAVSAQARVSYNIFVVNDNVMHLIREYSHMAIDANIGGTWQGPQNWFIGGASDISFKLVYDGSDWTFSTIPDNTIRLSMPRRHTPIVVEGKEVFSRTSGFSPSLIEITRY